MEISSVPDPAAAARHLDNAITALLQADRCLNRYKETAPLREVAGQLRKMANEFRNGMLNGGLEVSLITAASGARALGKSRSVKKLEALSKARTELARKRLIDRQQRDIRKYRKERSIPVI